MKLKTLFCGIAAAAMFTACSSDEPIQGPGEGGNNGGSNPDGTGYITVGINLPTVPSSRAFNDDFSHGETNEYAVYNNTAMLVLFTGDSEADATFHSAYEVALDTKADGAEGDNLTTSYRKTVKVNGVGNEDHLWGLVMLNYQNVAKTEAGADGKNIVKVITTTGDETVAKFVDLVGKIAADKFTVTGDDGKINIFMTNAPVSTAEGGTSQPDATKVQTLTEFGFGKNVVKPTEAEAQMAPAASFYVERALAKATLSANIETLVTGDLAKAGIVVKEVKWVIDNTEPNSYIIRNMGDLSYIGYKTNVNYATVADPYRMVGSVKIGQTAIQPVANLYRTYWCIDPQYNVAAANMVKHGDFKEIGTTNPQYCQENTFDVTNMEYKNTTHARIKVSFGKTDGSAATFYILNGVETDPFVSLETAMSEAVATIVRSGEVRNAFTDALNAEKTHTITAADLKIEYAKGDATNIWTVSDITFKSVEVGGDKDFKQQPVFRANEKANLIKAINATYNVVEYTNGVAYYDVRFKHFGDELTPWKNTTGATVDDTAAAYDGNNENFLGRYGMVRNNWYELSLTSIKKLGKPTEAELDVEGGKPDDNEEVEQWLSFNVNVLAWAKRVQNIEL